VAVLGLALALALAATGCGSSRLAVPNLSRPAAPGAMRAVSFARDGVALSLPRNWPVFDQRPPLLAIASSGPAVIVLWRFTAAAVPPSGAAELEQARQALIGAARSRQPQLELIRSAVVSVDGHAAVELDTIQRLRGQVRRIRSLHVYLPGHELVLEEYAPPPLFHATDHAVFSPVKRSLRLLGTRAS
jgi:hypothetical protein